MASEDLFSEDVQFSEDILFDKENLEEAINDVETNSENASDQQHSSAEVANVRTDSSGEPQPATDVAAIPKEKSSDQRLTSLPLTRIRNLMKLDPDLHIASLEAVFAVTKATEMFVDSLSKEAFVHTSQAKKKTVQKRDVDMAIASVDSLMFLEGAMEVDHVDLKGRTSRLVTTPIPITPSKHTCFIDAENMVH